MAYGGECPIWDTLFELQWRGFCSGRPDISISWTHFLLHRGWYHWCSAALLTTPSLLKARIVQPATKPCPNPDRPHYKSGGSGKAPWLQLSWCICKQKKVLSFLSCEFCFQPKPFSFRESLPSCSLSSLRLGKPHSYRFLHTRELLQWHLVTMTLMWRYGHFFLQTEVNFLFLFTLTGSLADLDNNILLYSGQRKHWWQVRFLFRSHDSQDTRWWISRWT